MDVAATIHEIIQALTAAGFTGITFQENGDARGVKAVRTGQKLEFTTHDGDLDAFLANALVIARELRDGIRRD